MRFKYFSIILLGFLFTDTLTARAQQAPESFHWVDFHSEKDKGTVVWVERALAVENWTAIREIGVNYDAALVVTTQRASTQTAANADSFSLWSVSLTNHMVVPLIKGVNPRWLDWMRFTDGAVEEPALLYENCRDCVATTYFTSFYYDLKYHQWRARWMQNRLGVPLWTESQPAGMVWTQAYAGVTEPNGRAQIYTWSHFDYGKDKEPSDSIYRYDQDPVSGLDRALPLVGRDAEAAKLRLCGQDAIPSLMRGQDAEMCMRLVGARSTRRIVTTPPVNNRGRIGAR